MKIRISMSCLVAIAAFTTGAAWAHHSGANFDKNMRYIFSGTVKTFLWSNPHTWVYVQVPRSDGSSELWGFELQGGTNSLRRAGWKATDLKVGDKIEILADLDRTGKRIAQVEELTLPDGRKRSAWPNGIPVGLQSTATPIRYK